MKTRDISNQWGDTKREPLKKRPHPKPLGKKNPNSPPTKTKPNLKKKFNDLY
jgi:hypothetical protein